MGRPVCGINKGQIPLTPKLFIDGDFVDSTAKPPKTIEVKDPSTEEVITSVQEASKDDIDIAVKAARAAFETFQYSDGSYRRDLLNHLADFIEEHLAQLSETESRDNGKPIALTTMGDIPLCSEVLRYYAGWADKLAGSHIPLTTETNKHLCYTRREPVGVCGQIIPWNFPMLMAIWKIAPAVAAGCTVVLKTSEKTPLTGLMLANLIKEAKFPKGVVNILSGGPTVGDYIVRHPGIDKIAFTGSRATGQKVQMACGEFGMKRLTLELGGKSPLIICADADMDLAVKTANLGLFWNMAQTCCASSRVYVEAGVYDEFVSKSAEMAKASVLTSPLDAKCTQGPQVDEIQFKKIMSYIEKGKADAKLVCGGNRHGTKGYYIEPTIFRDVKDESVICKEEIFGPVLCVSKFESLDEAIIRANASEYGLAAGICTRDIAKANQIANRLKVGTVYINCYNNFDAAIPFGGYKQSGQHREKGEEGLEPYLETKAVLCDISRTDIKAT